MYRDGSHDATTPTQHKERVIFYVPHCLTEIHYGCVRRCIQMLDWIGRCGFDIVVVSHLETYSDGSTLRWTETSARAFLSQTTAVCRLVAVKARLARRTLCSVLVEEQPAVVWINFQSSIDCTTLQQLRAQEPSQRRRARFVLDLHDAMSENKTQRQELARDYNDVAAFHSMQYRAAPKTCESEFLAQFDDVVAISQRDYDHMKTVVVLNGCSHSSRLHLVGYAVDEPPSAKLQCASATDATTVNNDDGDVVATNQTPPTTASGAALFVGSQNPFNVCGVRYFLERVVPLLLTETWELNVVGSVCLALSALHERLEPTIRNRVHLHGEVDDATLTRFYSDTKFVICPLVGGTGQKVKVVEALAHGRVVVASARSSTGEIEHGHNGFVAHTDQEFARAFDTLMRDDALCSAMSHNAATSSSHYQRQQWDAFLAWFARHDM